MRRRGVIVLNPQAGRGRAGNLRATLEQLIQETVSTHGQAADIDWEVHETTASGEGTILAARFAAEGAHVVAAAGGDGTLNEVLNGLMGTRAQLALLPVGTGNDFSRTVGLYGSLRRAVETLFAGIPRPIDVGRAPDRYFVNVAGCGFDAIVADRANRGSRFLRGTAAYLAAIVQTLARFRAGEFALTIDGDRREMRAMLCSVANARTYGGGMKIAPDALLDDGLFDICLLAEGGTIEFLRALPSVFKGTHTTHPKVTMLRARHIRVESIPPLPLLVDGEVVGTTPAEFTVLPAAIEFLFPA